MIEEWRRRLDRFVVDVLERIFYRWGKLIATRPVAIIVASLLFTALSCTGLYWFRTVAEVERLWVPSTSDLLEKRQWKVDFFEDRTRQHYAYLTHEEDVLNAEALIKMLRVHNQVQTMKVKGQSYEDVCLRVPVNDVGHHARRRRKRREAAIAQSADGGIEDVAATEEAPSAAAAADVQDGDIDYYEYVNFYDLMDGGTDDDDDDDNDDVAENRTEVAKVQKAEKKVDDSQIGNLPRDIYCDIVETLKDHCAEGSLLELWDYSEEWIAGLSRQQIVEDINNVKESPIFGYEVDFTKFLGGKRLNESGAVVGATAIRNVWYTEYDPDLVEKSTRLVGMEVDLADPFTMLWEERVINSLLHIAEEYQRDGYKLLPNMQRSYGDASIESLKSDTFRVFLGYLIMFAYTVVMLGKPNLVENRVWLAMMGLLAVGFGMAISLGLTMAVGLYYTTIHGVMAFLVLGIGIDDMFVIVQCYNNLSKEEKAIPSVAERIGLTMKHAGVAITVTSLTNVFAFGIGAITILPAIHAFCVTSTIAIASVFVLQTTWFVAWMAIDQRRIDDRRNGFIPCIKHEKWEPSPCSQKDSSGVIMRKIADLMKYRAVQGAILFTTLSFFSVGIWGCTQITQEFKLDELLPTDSYLAQWFRDHRKQFPDSGFPGEIFAGEIDYSMEQLRKLDFLVGGMERFAEEGEFVVEADFWWSNLKHFLQAEKGLSDWRDAVSSGKLPLYLSDYLFSQEGAKSKYGFRFYDQDGLVCGSPAPVIKAVKLGTFSFARVTGPGETYAVRTAVDSLIEFANFSTDVFSDSRVYSNWESQHIIGHELRRNIGLALTAVFVITLLMLSDLRLCCMVVLCVVFTIVDVIGMISWWDLQIDVLSATYLVLVVGLCVDYSTHIAHAFKVNRGSSYERARVALSTIGPAILNGGTTTFLALVLLAFSTSYAYLALFKIVFLSVVFGLFHGLVFLPVVLALFGKSDEDTADDNGNKSNKESDIEKDNAVINDNKAQCRHS